MKTKNKNAGAGHFRVPVAVLACLCAVSLTGLAVTLVRRQHIGSEAVTETISDNVIGSSPLSASSVSSAAGGSSAELSAGTEAAVSAAENETAAEGGQASLALYRGHPGDNEAFAVSGMLPGDKIEKKFCIRVSHKNPVTVLMKTDIRTETKNEASVLQVQVAEEKNGVLFSGTFSQLAGKTLAVTLPAVSTASDEDLYYTVAVSMDTSVGNEYQDASMKADIRWYTEDTNGLTTPQTGDFTSLLPWVAAAAAAAVLLIILIFRRMGAAPDEKK